MTSLRLAVCCRRIGQSMAVVIRAQETDEHSNLHGFLFSDLRGRCHGCVDLDYVKDYEP